MKKPTYKAKVAVIEIGEGRDAVKLVIWLDSRGDLYRARSALDGGEGRK